MIFEKWLKNRLKIYGEKSWTGSDQALPEIAYNAGYNNCEYTNEFLKTKTEPKLPNFEEVWKEMCVVYPSWSTPRSEGLYKDAVRRSYDFILKKLDSQ